MKKVRLLVVLALQHLMLLLKDGKIIIGVGKIVVCSIQIVVSSSGYLVDITKVPLEIVGAADSILLSGDIFAV